MSRPFDVDGGKNLNGSHNLKFNIQTSAKHNRALVLRLIKENPRISRSALADLTGLTRATITHILSELIAGKLVKEVELAPASSSGGRRAILLELIPDSHYVMGISLDRNNSEIILTDLMGQIIERGSFSYNGNLSPKDNIEQGVKLFLKDKPKLKKKLSGIGISTPGIINTVSGEIIYSYPFQWRHLNFRDELSKVFGLPVYLENNANAAALAEISHEDRRQYHTLVYIHIVEREAEHQEFAGLGCGIILNGEIYHGEHWGAGELFQTLNGVIRQACLEHPEFNNLLSERLGVKLLSQLLTEIKSKNQTALDFSKIISRELGVLCARIADVLDPGIIIMAGHSIVDNDYFFQEIEKTYHSFHPEFDGHVVLEKARFGRECVCRGAAGIVLNSIFIPIKKNVSILFD